MELSHQVRRKNPATGATLCHACCQARRVRRRKARVWGRRALLVAVALALAAAGAAMGMANLQE